MNEPGLTHLSFSVGDIPSVVEKVARHGGQVMADTDMTAAIMIRDPDGQLIELTSAGWLDVLPPLPE
jgi:predicted enzyme related to lactoylglutathione lyase